MKRTCENCTACCDGRLALNINGVQYGNNPCPHKGDGICKIYENRPKTPCVDYKCLWRRDAGNFLEDWMSPQRTNILVHCHKDNPETVELVTFKDSYRKEDLIDIKRKLNSKNIKTKFRER